MSKIKFILLSIFLIVQLKSMAQKITGFDISISGSTPTTKSGLQEFSVDKNGKLIITPMPTGTTDNFKIVDNYDKKIVFIDDSYDFTVRAIGSVIITLENSDRSYTQQFYITVTSIRPTNLGIVSVTAEDETIYMDETASFSVKFEPTATTNQKVNISIENEAGPAGTPSTIATLEDAKDANDMVIPGRENTIIKPIDGQKGVVKIIVTSQENNLLTETRNFTVDGTQTRPVSILVGSIEVPSSFKKNLTVGDKTQIIPIVRSRSGAMLANEEEPTNKNVIFTSTNSRIATVDSNGNIEAIARGRVTIKMEAEDASKTTSFVVLDITNVAIPGQIKDFKWNIASVNIVAGTSLIPTLNFVPKSPTNAKVDWSSTDNSIVKITNQGTIIGLKSGRASVTATTTDGSDISVTHQITVTTDDRSIKVDNLALFPKITSIVVGETLKLNAEVSPIDATNTNIEWYNSNPEVAALSNIKELIGLKEGKTDVSIISLDGTELKKTLTVNVVAKQTITPLTSIDIEVNNQDLFSDNAIQIASSTKPENATNSTLYWRSDNTAIATVDQTGFVTAIKFGNVTITASSTDGTMLSKSLQFQILRNLGFDLTGNPTPTSIGETTKLKVSTYPNPFNDNLTISSKSNTTIGLKYEIWNITGQKITSGILRKDRQILSTVKFKSGVYYIKFEKEAFFQVEKIIKN